MSDADDAAAAGFSFGPRDMLDLIGTLGSASLLQNGAIRALAEDDRDKALDIIVSAEEQIDRYIDTLKRKLGQEVVPGER